MEPKLKVGHMEEDIGRSKNKGYLMACMNGDCSWLGSRRYTSPYCGQCGSKMAKITVCCEHEDLADTGFCQYCGTKKGIMLYKE